jgi:ligand-binding sensor domain-containing protein
MINDNPVFFASADNIPRSVIGRPNGDIWINNIGGNGTLGTVRHYNEGGQLLTRMQTFNSGLPDYFVDKIKHDSAGNMWFATGEGGLTRMQGSDGSPTASTHWRNFGNHNDGSEPYPWAGSEPMYSVFEDTGGIFWMAGNGVGRWDSATGQFTNFWNTQNSNLDSSGMNVILKRQGTMWVGTGGSGVSWLNGNNWTRVLLSPSNYDANHVNAMTVDSANNLWVGSNYGLRKFAAGNNTNFTVYDASNSPLPSDYILDVIADPSGGIWIGTAAGLVRFDGTSWTIFNQANTGMPEGTSTELPAVRATVLSPSRTTNRASIHTPAA